MFRRFRAGILNKSFYNRAMAIVLGIGLAIAFMLLGALAFRYLLKG